MSEVERGFPRPVKMNIQGLLMYEDGYRDPRKVIVKPLDEDRDGVPDDPTILEEVVQNFNAPPQNLYFRKIVDFDGYEYMALWKAQFLSLPLSYSGVFEAVGSGDSAIWTVQGRAQTLERTIPVQNIDLLVLDLGSSVDQLVDFLNGATDDETLRQFDGLVVTRGGQFSRLHAAPQDSGWQLSHVITTDYATRVGRSFTLNRLLPFQNPLHFRWKHYAPRENRIDPSISNIIDMFVITNAYFREVLQWKNSRDDVESFPRPPTSESLRVQFGELSQFKMLSDEIVFKPGRFKLLFGRGAEPELQARFKVVKMPSTTLTDNEVKSRVIDAVESYFELENWDFGERFYYTELSAYIHQRLSNIISTVVIVPQKAESAFGNLFQIKSEVNELFLSTATVADVDVVSNLTETNLRIRRGDLFPPR